ncbi:ATP-binding protein [Bowmanella dokdonensis]|uniref:ATP-binding protein n=1 Tax=Bowmanella dokdonensis TaxID=751969 RepID=A0A939DNI2_9ALTE|nr:ATP-binding protein [Bowmanella dokdonensis]MBN7825773.1 ATP-binding protein [Bowmanella dokdonensis]
MRFLILRILTHSELGMFHEYRRQGKEGSKQRAINFDWNVVDRVFPAAKDSDLIEMDLLHDTDKGVSNARQWLKRQDKNWRLEGNCPKDKLYHYVEPGCLFAMDVEAGKSPASGAWAVFSADDHVTRAILADGESSGLAKSAMIALHDEEGMRTWQILSDARPDLFSAPKKEGIMSTPVKNVVLNNGVELAPNPARLVKILAAVGHTMPSAVADLVDNAISADATDISIKFGRPDGGHGRWMSITDNGCGMDSERLSEAMRIGGDSVYEDNSLGKYGYGLKGASWSQAKVFTVATKLEGEQSHHLTWDVDNMEGWIATSNPMEPWELEATVLGSSGTVVLWKDMRPPQNLSAARGLDPYSYEVMLLERHLALVFHRFLEGKAVGRKKVTITINGNHVEPNNPVGHPLASAYDAKTVRIPTEYEDGKVMVQAYLLPNEEEIAAYHQKEGADAARRARDLISLHGNWNDTQGLFIYRHDRLIKWGGWHQMWRTNDEKTKLARVVVNFDKVLDDAFKINISKQIVQLPMQLQAEIKSLANLARKDSQKKYRKPRQTPTTQPHAGFSTGANATRNGAEKMSAPTLSPTVSPGASPTPAPKVGIKEVKTDKFVWKVTKGMTGSLDIQVSDLNPGLSALVRQIRSDPHALSHLADFLGGLDEAEVQRHLMTERDD